MSTPKIFGSHQANTLEQLYDVASRAEHSALMADGHLGYIMPIGGVAAYRNKVSVVGVGFDIACGNCAIKTNLMANSFLQGGYVALANAIYETISFGIGRKNQSDDAPVDHELFESDAWQAVPVKFRDDLKKKAREQLGTVGSGNHYVDVFADEHGVIWVGVHFGSRGLGHTIASNFIAISQGLPWGERAQEKEVLLDLDSFVGQSYYELMELAGEYAYAGREWVARKVVSLLGGVEVDLVHNHHNFAWREEHFGEEFVVVRKGATPAFPGQLGFVGGSMGDPSVILRGSSAEADIAEQEAALYSTVHGAGRVMSRTEAAGKTKRYKVWQCGNRDCGFEGPARDYRRGRNGELPLCPRYDGDLDAPCGGKMHLREKRELVRPGKITAEMMNDWIGKAGVILRGGGLDESPHAYRRLSDVIADQGDTVRVEHVLQPLVVVMAGADEYDPYKD